jgi:hypothetical protein
MPKNVRVAVTTLFAIAFVGLTLDYFPDTRAGYILSTTLFVVAAYPVYRALEIGPDRTYAVVAPAFVPAVSVMHELRQYLPVPFVRYSAAVMVAGSFAIMIERLVRRREP